MKNYKKLHAKVIFLSIPSIILGAITPFVLTKIVNLITEQKSTALIQYFLLFACLLILTKCFDLLFNYHFNTLDHIVANTERKTIIDKIINSKPNNTFAYFSSEKIINRTMNEVYSLGTLHGIAPVMIIINIIMFIVALIVLAILNFRLLIFTCLVIPLIYILGNLLKKRITRVSELEVKSYEKVLMHLGETIKGLNDIKIFKVHKNTQAKMHKLCDEFLVSSKKLLFINRVYQDVQSILFSLLPVLALLLGFYLTSIGKGTLATTLSFYMYVSYFIEPVTNLSNARMMIFNSKRKAELVEELKTEIDMSVGGTELLDKINQLKATHLCIDFEKVKLDTTLDIRIDAPGLYGLSADSGSGKSTLLKIISGLLYSSESEISLSGQDVRTISPESLIDKTCYLSSDSFVFEGSILDTVELSNALQLNTEALSWLFDKSENMSQSTFIESEGANISLGQKQRLIILRLMSLINKPDLIILDEALSGVDEEREAEILKKLKLHFSETIIIIVTHRTSTFSFCDKVFEL